MDKRTLAAVGISLAIWLGWHKIYFEPHQKAQKEWQEYQASLEVEKENAEAAKKKASDPVMKSDSGSTPNKALKTAKPVKEVAQQEKSLHYPNMELLVSNGPNLLNGWQVGDYKTSNEIEADRRKIDLLWVSGFSNQMSLGFSGAGLDKEFTGNFEVLSKNDDTATYRDRYEGSQFTAERSVSQGAHENTLKLKYSLEFRGEVPAFVFINLYGNPKRDNDTEGSIFGEHPDKVELTYFNREGRHTELAAHLKEPKEATSSTYWLGINTRYFLFAALPDGQELIDQTGVQIARGSQLDPNAVVGRLVFPTNGKTKLEIPLNVYFGPKKLELLSAVSPSLPNAIDFGWFSFIAIPLLKMLKAVYGVVGNYGVAIILVTLFVKILLFPLTYKSMKSMAKLSLLKPELERIQKKYADDKQKQQQEIWALYKNNGANPLSGCLPILLQMPVFFALYRVLFNCMELYQAPFFLWIHDLSARDHFFVTPILLIGLMYLQQVNTPTTNVDPSQQAAMKLMPIMFGVFMIFLPSGLNIYMIVNTLFTLVQQYFLNRKFGIGQFASSPVATAEAK